MISNILKIAALSCTAGGYYVANYNQISIKNPQLSFLFRKVDQLYPQYAQSLFKIFIKLNLIEQDTYFNEFMLKAGFDIQGSIINQIRSLGFKGIQIGPTTYNPSLEEDVQQTLGIKSVLANILTYKQNAKDSPFIIELNISPNYQILKYTPYLLQENIQQALYSYFQIQQLIPINIVNKININFDRKDYNISTNKEQLQKILNKIKQEISKSIDEFNKQRQNKVHIQFNIDYKGYVQWNDILKYIVREKTIIV